MARRNPLVGRFLPRDLTRAATRSGRVTPLKKRGSKRTPSSTPVSGTAIITDTAAAVCGCTGPMARRRAARLASVTGLSVGVGTAAVPCI